MSMEGKGGVSPESHDVKAKSDDLSDAREKLKWDMHSAIEDWNIERARGMIGQSGTTEEDFNEAASGAVLDLVDEDDRVKPYKLDAVIKDLSQYVDIINDPTVQNKVKKMYYNWDRKYDWDIEDPEELQRQSDEYERFEKMAKRFGLKSMDDMDYNNRDEVASVFGEENADRIMKEVAEGAKASREREEREEKLEELKKVHPQKDMTKIYELSDEEADDAEWSQQ